MKDFENGKINTHLQTKGGVDKHNPVTREYRDYTQARKASGINPPSYFTEDPHKLYPEVLARINDPKTITNCFGSPLRIVQYMTFDRPVGFTYNQDGTKVQTSLLTVIYSDKHGIHYYPDSETKKEGRK